MSEEEMRKEENLEHEVLDRLRLVTKTDFNKDLLDDSYIDAVLKAINIVLDLYKQEKEKNKELRNICKELIKEKQELTTVLLDDNIPKSKIKEKIEELENKDLEIYDTDSEDVMISKYEERAILDFCKELLEENRNDR